MKLRCKQLLPNIIRAQPGDTVMVTYSQIEGGKTVLNQVVAKCDITEDACFNTSIIYELEPGDLGFECGFLGGLVWENK